MPDEKKVSILLNGGMNNWHADGLIAPVVQQGQSPVLKQSTNTRLSIRPGTVTRSPAATTLLSLTANSPRCGLVPSAAGKNAALLRRVSSNVHDIVSGTGTGSGNGQLSLQADHYFPVRVTGAGAFDSVDAIAGVAHSYNSTSGVIWRVSAFTATDTALYYSYSVSAWSADGTMLAPPSPIIPVTIQVSGFVWVGVTSHAATGDRLWYKSNNGICYRTIALSGTAITFGSEVVVVVPGAAGTGLDVVAGDATYAYLAHAQVGSATGATIRKVDITNGSTAASVNVANGLDGGGRCAVHYGTLGGNVRVAVAWSKVTGALTTLALYDADLAVVGAAFTIAGYGDVALGFGNSTRVFVGISEFSGDFAGAPETLSTTGVTAFYGTRIYWTAAASWGTLGVSIGYPLPWLLLQSRGAYWSSRDYPVFTFHRCYGNVDYGPGADNYVDDSSVEAYLVTGDYLHPLARVGVVRGGAAPAQSFPETCLSSSGAFMVGDVLHLAYKKQPLTVSTPIQSPARYVTLDFSANTQPPVAHDGDGLALIAAALPAQFDGSQIVELGGPLHTPRISIDTTYASGPVPAAGVYRVAVYFTWQCAAGLTHRSRPSNVIARTCDGVADRITVCVTLPDGLLLSSSSRRVRAHLYVSETNGSTLHLQRSVIIASSVTTLWISAIGIYDITAGDAGQPQIYTTQSAGEELAPQPPPPLRDIFIIGSRCWGIDAEYPNRLVYSKYRVAGVGYEFHPAFEVILPSTAGDAYAVREWAGLTVAFCERGVFAIAGEGPDNTGGGGTFAPPSKMSDIGCTNTASVAVFPGGILWQSGDRFALLSGGGAAYLQDYKASYDVSHALVMQRGTEVWLFSSSTAGARVFNYERKAWTEWDSQTIPAAVTAACTLPWDPDKAWIYSLTTGALRELNANSTSTVTNLSVTTDWTAVGGDFQDHVIFRSVVFDAYYAGAHSLTIEMYVDYSTTAETYTFDAATITAAAGTQGRYSIRFEPRQQNGRVVKFRVYDTLTGTGGMNPKSITLYYAVSGAIYEEPFSTAAGTYKG